MNRVVPGAIVKPVKDDLATYSEPRLGIDTVQSNLSQHAIIMVVCRLPEVKDRSLGENGVWVLVLADDVLGWVPIVWLENWWATEGYQTIDPTKLTTQDLLSWRSF